MTKRRSGASAPQAATKRAAIYTRKSTSQGLEQEFNSLDAQREACELYINARAHEGWQLAPEHYDDGGFTGANIERPAFQRLLAEVDAHKVDVVVVYKVDRLSRSLLDFAQVMDRFNKADVAFVSVTQNFSTADAMGRLTLNMLMSFAEFEREMIAERTRDKIAAARRRGKWTGGRLPIGYDLEDKKLVVNDLEAIVVREVFDLYLELRSALAVTKAFNDRGRVTKYHEAQSGNIQNGGPWTKDTVLRVLRNHLYAGLIASGDELHQGEHEAIVARETWARAQALLGGVVSTTGRPRGAGGERTDRTRGRPPNPAYLLRGLLRCKCHNWALTPASTRKDGREYRYYRPLAGDKKGKEACHVRPLPAGAIEELVIGQLRKAVANGAFAAEVLRKVKTQTSERRDKLAEERAALPPVIAQLAAEGQALAGRVQVVTGPVERLLNDRLQVVGADLARQESRLAEVERQLAILDELVAEVEWIASVLRDFDSLWEVMTPANRYRLVHAIVQDVVIDGKAGTVTATLVDFAGDVGDELDLEANTTERTTSPGHEQQVMEMTVEAVA